VFSSDAAIQARKGVVGGHEVAAKTTIAEKPASHDGAFSTEDVSVAKEEQRTTEAKEADELCQPLCLDAHMRMKSTSHSCLWKAPEAPGDKGENRVSLYDVRFCWICIFEDGAFPTKNLSVATAETKAESMADISASILAPSTVAVDSVVCPDRLLFSNYYPYGSYIVWTNVGRGCATDEYTMEVEPTTDRNEKATPFLVVFCSVSFNWQW
jgi:hypothetical protein